MATLAALTSDVRSRIVEPTADYFSDAEIAVWLNQGYKNFIAETLWTEKTVAISPVADQFEYVLPSDYIFTNLVMWDDRWPIHDRDIEEFRRYVSTANMTKSTRPYIYRLWPWDGKFRVYPIPNQAITTTVNGAHNSSVTTITVVDTSLFPTHGRVIIGTEQILYTGKTATTLTGLVRGDMFTTAASHTTADVVYFGRMELYISYMPPDMTSTIDSRVGVMFDEALIAYATAIAMTKRDKYSQASYYQKIYAGLTKKASELKAQRDRDRLFAIKDDYPEYML